MKARWMLVMTLVASLGAQGCASGRRYLDKPWGKRTWVPAAICAAVGAGAGIGIKEATRGESVAVSRYPDGSIANSSYKKDDKDYWQGALIGAAAGSLLCGLVGHFFEPDAESVPPPPPEALPAPTAKRIVLRGVNFDFDKSEIRSDSRPILDEASTTLNENPQVRVSVEGHTDSMGTDAYNERLSVQRAEAVFRYMVNQGITPERMGVVGYGESRPVADNDTDSGRAENRRVELNVVKTGESNGASPEPRPAPAAQN